MKKEKGAYKPKKPDAEIIQVLHMLATGETWDNIEGETYWSRSSIGVARAWFVSLNNEDAAEYVSHCDNRETILQWRIGQKLAKGGYRKLQEGAPPEKLHLENIKDAITWWKDSLAGLPLADLVDLPQTLGFSAWGVVASASPGGGSSRASPIYGNHALRDSLLGHLVPPVVDSDFWTKVGEMPSLGLSLLGSVRSLSQRIEREACQNTQQPFIKGDFRSGPVTGLTEWYVRTIVERALGLSAAIYQGYITLTVVYGDGGVVLTSKEEGLRLFYQQGWDPRIQTSWAREAIDWIEPPDTAHRMLLGEADWMYTLGRWPLRFVLCIASREIALVATPEELEACYQAHRSMMADADTCSEVQAINRIRARLDLESKRVAEILGRALLSTDFPGHCPRCPQ